MNKLEFLQQFLLNRARTTHGDQRFNVYNVMQEGKEAFKMLIEECKKDVN
jgi:hypothetical protein